MYVLIVTLFTFGYTPVVHHVPGFATAAQCEKAGNVWLAKIVAIPKPPMNAGYETNAFAICALQTKD